MDHGESVSRVEFDRLAKRVSCHEGSTAWARAAERDIVRHDRELWHLRVGLRTVGVLLAVMVMVVVAVVV